MYHPTLKVHLIDTPGFDDTNRSDVEVLQNLAHWLSISFEKGIKLSGIIFLHRISDVRLAGSARRNLLMFKKLCGEKCYSSVLLATTMWDKVDETTGAKRENELVTTDDFWGLMYRRGSKVFRHTGSQESALRIVKHILTLDTTIVLEIQDEIVNNKKGIEDTAAAQELNAEIIREKKRHQAEMEEMRRGMEQAMTDRDEELQRFFKEEHDKLQDKIKKGEKEQKKLKDSLEAVHRRKEEELQAFKKQIEAERRRDQERYDRDRTALQAQFERNQKAMEDRQKQDIDRLIKQSAAEEQRAKKDREMQLEMERLRLDCNMKIEESRQEHELEMQKLRNESRGRLSPAHSMSRPMLTYFRWLCCDVAFNVCWVRLHGARIS